MKGIELIEELKRKFAIQTDRALAKRLGMTSVALADWKRRRSPLSVKQIANAIDKASKSSVTESQRSTIRPIVEFFPIEKILSEKSDKCSVLPVGKDAGRHRAELKAQLEKSKGLYIFYDTRGKALYAGQTRRQNLWKEINLAFNRDRSAQVMTLVRHPKKDVAFKSANEKVRQPTDITLKLHDLAAYFSAFEVADQMVDELEALLVRAFPNDLLNLKMEKFGKAAKKASVKKASKKAGRKTASRRKVR